MKDQMIFSDKGLVLQDIYRWLPPEIATYFQSNFWLGYVIGLSLIIGFSFIANFITRKVFLNTVNILAKKSANQFDDILIQNNVFHRLAHLAPAMVIYLTATLLPQLQTLLLRLSMTYMILVVLSVLFAIIDTANTVYKQSENNRTKPIKGYLQLVKTLLGILTAIFVFSTLMNKSPWGILSGIGAMSAILLLVFKDALMGLVAGFQLTANKMVKLGDWIEIPKYGADGDVIEINLTTVKVQNWDKTISTVPVTALINHSFKNWKGMSESGGRRIKRSIYIDMNSISFLSPKLKEKLSQISLLHDYMNSKETEVQSFNQQNKVNASSPINGRNLTNIGTFRAYIIAYLTQHPQIHSKMTFLVRQLQSTDKGLPIEIYVFSKDQNWVNYEGIQGDIFDHLISALPEFNLRVYQQPSGYDFQGQFRG